MTEHIADFDDAVSQMLDTLPPDERASAEAGLRTGMAIQSALRFLRGAGRSPAFGTNIEDMEEVWCLKLTGCPPASIAWAANEWVEAAEGWPDVTEIATLAFAHQRRMEQEARAEHLGPRPSYERGCHHCGTSLENPDPQGMLYVHFPTDEDRRLGLVKGQCVIDTEPPTDGSPADRLFCPVCRPVQHELQMSGCFMPNHHGCEKCQPGRR